MFNKATLVLNGQGLGDTKWKGWDWNNPLIEVLTNKIFFKV